MTRSAGDIASRSRLRTLVTTGRRRWRASTAVLVLLVLLGLLLFAWLEGDLPDYVGDGLELVRPVLRNGGPLGAYTLLYLEESGVPMPMPGDVFVMYVGHHMAGRAPILLGAWLALIGVVLLGATNLYFVSRRWGRALLERRLAHALHMTPARMAKAEQWFGRWGPWALIVGRHIPGFRVPLTVGAGVFGVGYRTFALCVVVSTAIWAGFFIIIGATFGGRVQHLLAVHRGFYAIPGAIVLLFVGYFVYRLWQVREAPHRAV